MNQMVF